MIVTLIALPIAAMTAFAVVMWSTVATPEEEVHAELGQMQAWVQPVGAPDSGFWQAPTQPSWNGYELQSNGEMIAPEGAPLDDPAGALPAGAETIPVVEGQVRTATDDGVASVSAWAGEVWHERFAGRFDLVDGRAAQTASEALVTPAALKRIGTSIGGEIALPDTDDTYTVVGTMTAAYTPADQAVLFLPADAPVSGSTKWFLPERSLSWADVQALNEQGIIAYSREVVLDPPATETADPWGNAYDQSSGVMWSLFGILAAAAAFAAYVVIMLAGAAFSVAARRQQRSLAVAASVGAAPADLRRTIVLQGTALGLIGGVAGLALGVGVGAGIIALTDDGSGTRYWGFHVPWLALAAIAIFSVLVGTAAAAVPARSVSRTDTLSALRGARRPQVPRASRPVWGSIILVIGVALTIASAVGTAALQSVSQEDIAWDSPLRAIPPFGIVIGPILVQVGILLSGRWLLWLTSRVLSRVSLAARIATRDAAANASRTVPAFAAIGATVFIAVFALSQASMQNASTARHWYYQAPVGALSVEFYPGGEGMVEPLTADEAALAAESATEIVTDAGADSVVAIHRQSEHWNFASVSDVPEDLLTVIPVMPEDQLLDPGTGMSFSSGQDRTISVIDADGLSAAIGAELSDAQLSAYRDGAALVTDAQWVSDGTLDVGTWTVRDAYEDRVPSAIWARPPGAPPIADPQREVQLDALTVDLPHQPNAIAVSPETADELGMVTEPVKVVATFADPLTDEQLDRIRSHAELLSTADTVLSPYLEHGPDEDAFWMIPILAGVGVLVLAASSVALGLARFERRPDDATLTAIGTTPQLRRRIEFWQGLLIAGFGTVTGTVAGVLPAIGFAIQSQGRLLIADTPWIALAGLAVALPLLIAVASWLIPPRAADLTRRTVIA
ncbi:FtsX-like permease family protein [Microbacterium sp.]|uniref:ABC transporter permease n=1 Tax=Microbacterium sp. TaxID=51671 RepID=UPI00261D5D0D|nr:FtsX-like permease family protein [Microbacterium sp.]